MLIYLNLMLKFKEKVFFIFGVIIVLSLSWDNKFFIGIR